MPTPEYPQPRSAAGRHGMRVPSDAARSILSARSLESATSAGASISVPLARRTLNPPSRHGAPLPPIIPPLTTNTANPSNDIPRLNDEIYDLIALALRGYVSSWYQRLSPRDKEFVPEVSKVTVAVLRAVDERVRAADLDCLLLHDFSVLVSQHFRDYRLARSKVHTAYASGGSQDSDNHAALVHIFHNIQAHLAISPDGAIDDTYLRQAVDHVLKTCLPPQDWTSEMERSIVREIIVKPILGSVLPKLAEPWFLHSIALSLLGSPRPLEVRFGKHKGEMRMPQAHSLIASSSSAPERTERVPVQASASHYCIPYSRASHLYVLLECDSICSALSSSYHHRQLPILIIPSGTIGQWSQ